MLTAKEALARAEQLARQYHEGQVDLAGKPYIQHIQAVVNGVDTTEEKTVAWMHDLVEDTTVTIDFLRSQGFSESILQAVSLITRKKPGRYRDYISALSTNNLARRVKISDLRHNLDLTRLPAEDAVSSRTARRVRVYREALDTLLAIEECAGYATIC